MITESFAYRKAHTVDELMTILEEFPEAVIKAGGTDLLGLMKRGIIKPGCLIDIRSIPELTAIEHENNGLKIGAAVSLDRIAGDGDIARRFPALAAAAKAVGTPQIRNIGTIGGNLLQAPRCMYYRHPDFRCLRRGGSGCMAALGRNRYSGVFGGSACRSSHPSDLAPALLALGAAMTYHTKSGPAVIPLDGLYRQPEAPEWRDTVFNAKTAAVHVDAPAQNGPSIFVKISERKAIDFAQVSVAVSVDIFLLGVGVIRAVIAHVAHAVEIGILLCPVRVVRTVVTHVAHGVSVTVLLSGIDDEDAVIASISHTVAETRRIDFDFKPGYPRRGACR